MSLNHVHVSYYVVCFESLACLSCCHRMCLAATKTSLCCHRARVSCWSRDMYVPCWSRAHLPEDCHVSRCQTCVCVCAKHLFNKCEFNRIVAPFPRVPCPPRYAPLAPAFPSPARSRVGAFPVLGYMLYVYFMFGMLEGRSRHEVRAFGTSRPPFDVNSRDLQF